MQCHSVTRGLPAAAWLALRLATAGPTMVAFNDPSRTPPSKPRGSSLISRFRDPSATPATTPQQASQRQQRHDDGREQEAESLVDWRPDDEFEDTPVKQDWAGSPQTQLSGGRGRDGDSVYARRPPSFPVCGVRDDDGTGTGCGPWNSSRRAIMAVLGMTMWLVCYCDRTNISLAIVEMETEFGWSESTDGLVLSSFFVGCETALPG
jgi:hypothetical protein